MRLLNAFVLLATTIAAVYAGGQEDNEMTFYGCPDDCNGQREPSCSGIEESDLPSHFAALSTSLSHYDDYCGNYAVFMLSDGSNVKKLAKATVVDSCSSCSEYHLDLSSSAFGELRSHNSGTGKIIWGIYSKSGSKLAGPYYNSVSGSAEKLGMNTDKFVEAFDANAKKLASSHDNAMEFSSTITNTNTTTTIATTKTVPVTAAAKTVPTNAPKQETKKVNDVINESKPDENNSLGTAAVSVLAIGGGVIGAAGVGLVFMKKKNPKTIDGFKQKFPEAFTNVKRGLTRKATSLKRKVTHKAPKPTADAMNV